MRVATASVPRSGRPTPCRPAANEAGPARRPRPGRATGRDAAPPATGSCFHERTSSTAAGKTSSTPVGRQSAASSPSARGESETTAAQHEEDAERQREKESLGVGEHHRERARKQRQHPHGALSGTGITRLEPCEPMDQDSGHECAGIRDRDDGPRRRHERQRADQCARATGTAGRSATPLAVPSGSRRWPNRDTRSRPT